MVTHGVQKMKKTKKFHWKVFQRDAWGQIVNVCASSVFLSLGMTEFDCEKSIIVSHILLKMPTRQLEDQCCPINIYSTLLTTHFVYQQQTESDPNVNEFWLDLLPRLVLENSMPEGHRQNDLLLQHCRGYLWPEFVSIIDKSEAGPEKA